MMLSILVSQFLLFTHDFIACIFLSKENIWIFVQTLVTFHNLGALLGRLAPRCTDPSAAVRRAAIDCIYSLLHIQLRYEGNILYYNNAPCII